ncbi:hypothetical protein LBR04_23820 [Levilactobacillus brevis]|nr:hypothetical protein LBR04_23820 [Levilactobacillus brevis]
MQFECSFCAVGQQALAIFKGYSSIIERIKKNTHSSMAEQTVIA